MVSQGMQMAASLYYKPKPMFWCKGESVANWDTTQEIKATGLTDSRGGDTPVAYNGGATKFSNGLGNVLYDVPLQTKQTSFTITNTNPTYELTASMWLVAQKGTDAGDGGSAGITFQTTGNPIIVSAHRYTYVNYIELSANGGSLGTYAIDVETVRHVWVTVSSYWHGPGGRTIAVYIDGVFRLGSFTAQDLTGTFQMTSAASIHYLIPLSSMGLGLWDNIKVWSGINNPTMLEEWNSGSGRLGWY